MPSKAMRLARTSAPGISRRIARPVIVLPEPDSPTMASRSRSRLKETPRTASTGPVSVRKVTCRSSTSSRLIRGLRSRGSSTSRRPSPSRLKPSETMKIARPGIVATHHWSKRNLRPEEIISPHSGSGGCAPSPRKPRPAAVRMMPAMSRVTRMITDGTHIGATCARRIRPPPAPCSRAAAM